MMRYNVLRWTVILITIITIQVYFDACKKDGAETGNDPSQEQGTIYLDPTEHFCGEVSGDSLFSYEYCQDVLTGIYIMQYNQAAHATSFVVPCNAVADDSCEFCAYCSCNKSIRHFYRQLKNDDIEIQHTINKLKECGTELDKVSTIKLMILAHSLTRKNPEEAIKIYTFLKTHSRQYNKYIEGREMKLGCFLEKKNDCDIFLFDIFCQ